MLVLLPPSKSMRPGGEGPPWRPSGPLADARATVAAAYEELLDDRAAFGEVTEAAGDVLDDAIDQARGLRTDSTAPAGHRYSGQLHLAAGYAELDSDGRRAYARHVRILSGLLGVAAPDELVPRYRLPMGARMPGIGGLATFWRGPLGDELMRHAGDGVVLDLLSHEYRRALPRSSDLQVVRVRFERPRGDGWRAAPAVVGKQLKGAFARHVALHGPGNRPRDLSFVEHFRSQGYRFAGWRDGPDRTLAFRSDG